MPVASVTIAYTGAPGPMRLEVADSKGGKRTLADIRARPIPLDQHEDIVVGLKVPVRTSEFMLSADIQSNLPFRVFKLEPSANSATGLVVRAPVPQSAELPQSNSARGERPAAEESPRRSKRRSSR